MVNEFYFAADMVTLGWLLHYRLCLEGNRVFPYTPRDLHPLAPSSLQDLLVSSSFSEGITPLASPSPTLYVSMDTADFGCGCILRDTKVKVCGDMFNITGIKIYASWQ